MAETAAVQSEVRHLQTHFAQDAGHGAAPCVRRPRVGAGQMAGLCRLLKPRLPVVQRQARQPDVQAQSLRRPGVSIGCADLHLPAQQRVRMHTTEQEPGVQP